MASPRSNLPNAPILKSMPALVEAVHYNNAFIALSRIGAPLKLMLPGLRGVEVRLDQDAWVCYDHNLNHQPLLAWTDFRSNVRSGLYEPVPCQLLMYHPYATVLMRTLPDDINRLLIRRLSRNNENSEQAPAKILLF